MKKYIQTILITTISSAFILGIFHGIVLCDMIKNTEEHKYCKVKMD